MGSGKRNRIGWARDIHDFNFQCFYPKNQNSTLIPIGEMSEREREVWTLETSMDKPGAAPLVALPMEPFMNGIQIDNQNCDSEGNAHFMAKATVG